MTASDNVRIWDGARPGHYEVWFLTFNHRPTNTGYWIRYTLESPTAGRAEPYCQLWFARFSSADPEQVFGINQKHPIEAMDSSASPFSVSIGEDALLRDDGALGALAGDGHTVSWDLQWAGDGPTHRQMPGAMYLRDGLGDTTYLSPNYGVELSGTVTVDGKQVELHREPGSQMHLWGKKHAHRWGWGHACALDGYRGARVEVLSAQLKKAGRVLPPLTMVTLDLGDERLHFNQVAHLPLNRGSVDTGLLRFSGQNLTTRVEGEFSCPPERMLVATYEDPDGEDSYCSNTESGDLSVVVHKRAGLGWREHVRLSSSGNAHFEVGSRQRDPAIGKQHVTV